jgi:hypothetical protein
MAAAKLLPALERAAKDRQLAGRPAETSGSKDPEVGRARDQAASSLSVSGASVARAARLRREDPELAAAVERGVMTLGAALEVVKGSKAPTREQKIQIEIEKYEAEMREHYAQTDVVQYCAERGALVQTAPDAAPNERDRLDRYYSPPWTARALVELVPECFNGDLLLDPCAGRGDLLHAVPPDLGFNFVNKLGLDVDREDRMWELARRLVCRRADLLVPGEAEEVLAAHRAANCRRVIITNPPYLVPHARGEVRRNGETWATAAQFLRRCLELAPRVAALVRLSWLEPAADRADLLSQVSRVVILPRVRYEVPQGSPPLSGTDTQTSCWVIWDGTSRAGGAQTRWVTAEEARAWGRGEVSDD